FSSFNVSLGLSSFFGAIAVFDAALEDAFDAELLGLAVLVVKLAEQSTIPNPKAEIVITNKSGFFIIFPR
ncbi:MAG: hypothetical protein ABJA66_19175, partial [Actinomycetota bacterium]